MGTKELLEYANFLALFLCLATLVIMWRRRVHTAFSMVAAFLCVQAINEVVSLAVLFFRRYTGLSKVAAYDTFFVFHWVCLIVGATLMIAIIYSVFHKAMLPLMGLHKIGRIVFRWVAGVSVLVSVCIAFGPFLFWMLSSRGAFSVTMITGQIQQGISVLTLCLLLFVCFSVKPLGLTYRSHIFGISLGLGVIAALELVATAWYAPGQSLYAPVYTVRCFGICVGFVIWAAYFLVPQPKRQMVLLPTTSPYFMWNRIAEALGDEPGDVAVAGFKPDSLTPAEMAVITAQTSRAKKRREAEAKEAAEQELVAR